MIRIDMRCLLDKCAECRAHAGFEHSDKFTHIRAGCSECCNLGEWMKDSLYDTIVPWNLAQRKDRPQKDIPVTVLPDSILKAISEVKARKNKKNRKQ